MIFLWIFISASYLFAGFFCGSVLIIMLFGVRYYALNNINSNFINIFCPANEKNFTYFFVFYLLITIFFDYLPMYKESYGQMLEMAH
ncbi:hypothetical protein BpHYR1_033965 [Brachionus plicatilis]|uniref:Uncharacterized protein n=1 Tax=Brachionus plicatilis TaxID=10195 RepID=A0A3M7QLJ4_BRAPC|nr:hypothetical protein BpHYR1_033965 [Brachionus plicatilis]